MSIPPDDLAPPDESLIDVPNAGEDVCPLCAGAGSLPDGECPDCAGTGCVIADADAD